MQKLKKKILFMQIILRSKNNIFKEFLLNNRFLNINKNQ